MLARLALACMLAVVAASSQPAHAQATTGSAPQGFTTCDFAARSNDSSAQGLAVRAAPDAAAQTLGYIPAADPQASPDPDAKPNDRFRVVGAKDGWFQIAGASYVALQNLASQGDKGWVDSHLVTVRLYRETLKAEPKPDAPDVVYLVAYDGDGAALYSPETVEVSRVFGCSGRWLEVEIQLPGAKALTGEPASPNGAVRGWTDRTCMDVDFNGKCASQQFDYQWSPLPSGVTECNFVAFNRDPDPAGLNVRAEPDANARILGRLPLGRMEPSDRYSTFGADVIGFKKGWFLIEHGFEAVWTPQRPREPVYTGRGWVAASLVTAQLMRENLKLAPDGASPDVLALRDVKGEGPDDSFFVTPRRILGCSGNWVHVEIGLHPGEKPLTKTDAPPGAVRGWVNSTCASQTTPCVAGQNTPPLTSPPAPLPVE